MATDFYESEMALISEWMEQCGKKILDNAGIVREACSRQIDHDKLTWHVRSVKVFCGGVL
jgi:hypothetical protein